MTQKQLILTVGGIVAALLAAVLIVGILILNGMNAQRSQANYEDCMARYGFEADAPPAPGDDVDNWIDGIAAASEKCSSLR